MVNVLDWIIASYLVNILVCVYFCKKIVKLLCYTFLRYVTGGRRGHQIRYKALLFVAVWGWGGQKPCEISLRS